MKSVFSLSWLSSSQPRKQRKYVFNAPLHTRGDFLHARLSKELQKKHSIRSLRVRKGDKVSVMRGQFKGKVGLVERVDLGRSRIYVAGVEMVKKEGGKVSYPLHASNVLLTAVTDDKKRFKQKSQKKE